MLKLYVDVVRVSRYKMPKIKIFPHHEICPNGAVIENLPGETVCEAALRNGIKIEHACEMSCACTTCHIVVRKGFNLIEMFVQDPMLCQADLLRCHLHPLGN